MLDTPFGVLPPSGRIKYEKAQLQAVVGEIRFISDRSELTAADTADGLDRFGPFGFDQLEPIEQRQLAVTFSDEDDALPEVTTIARGWQYSSSDKSRVITLMPSSVSLQLTTYQRWSQDFAPPLRALVTAAAEICGAAVLQRAGLRYINRLDVDDGWESVVRASIAGVLTDSVLGSKVAAAHQQFELVLEPNIGAVVRHGPLATPHGLAGYLVDLDVFDARVRRFDLDGVNGTMQRLNRTSVSLFNYVLSDEQVERLGAVNLDEGSAE